MRKGLLRVDEIQDGVGARQVCHGGAAVGGVERRKPRRIGDDEPGTQEWRIDGDDDERWNGIVLGDGVVERPSIVALADGNET